MVHPLAKQLGNGARILDGPKSNLRRRVAWAFASSLNLKAGNLLQKSRIFSNSLTPWISSFSTIGTIQNKISSRFFIRLFFKLLTAS